jgi:hypothetical protein
MPAAAGAAAAAVVCWGARVVRGRVSPRRPPRRAARCWACNCVLDLMALLCRIAEMRDTVPNAVPPCSKGDRRQSRAHAVTLLLLQEGGESGGCCWVGDCLGCWVVLGAVTRTHTLFTPPAASLLNASRCVRIPLVGIHWCGTPGTAIAATFAPLSRPVGRPPAVHESQCRCTTSSQTALNVQAAVRRPQGTGSASSWVS